MANSVREDVRAALDLVIPLGLNIIVKGHECVARGSNGLDFVANGPGYYDTLVVTVHDEPVYIHKLQRGHNMSAGDTLSLDDPDGEVAMLIYQLIETGVFARESCDLVG